ncbi:MAG: hypothetical protein HEQ24_01240 [Dolichospermum sp. BR01]|nr:hypothetical protein [Dolichospermum sp. BR01]
MITTRFQKWGALAASLASILTLSSAAEAITFSSAAGGTIGKLNSPNIGSPATRTYQLIPAPTDTRRIEDFNSITINNLRFANKANLKATLLYSFTSPDPNITGIRSFTLFDRNSSAGALNGNYTFVSNGGLNWSTASAVSPSTVAGGVYNSVDDFFSLGDPVDDPSFINGTWTLQLQSFNTTYTPQGTFSNFSIDVAPVPFESNAAPAGVAIVFGALMLRRKLQQRSAQKMSLESVNS